MKNIFKIVLLLLIVFSTSISCTESDNPVDVLLDTVDMSGAIVRTLSPPAEFIINANPDGNTIALEIEVQEGNGDFDPDFKEVRLYIGIYQAQDLADPIVDGQGTPTSEILMVTAPKSDFVNGDNGLPTYEFSFITPDVVAQFPADAVYPIPSFIETRLELEMNDGRVFSKESVAAAVATGIYFDSPFSYVTIFINPPS